MDKFFHGKRFTPPQGFGSVRESSGFSKEGHVTTGNDGSREAAAGETRGTEDLSRRNLVVNLLGFAAGGLALEALSGCAGGRPGAEQVAAIQAAASGIAAPYYADTVAELRGMIDELGAVAILKGYYAPGDGGGGVFYWDPNQAVDDGGTFLNANGLNGAATAGWRRLYSGEIHVKWFGAKGDGAADDTSAINAAIAAMPSWGVSGVASTTGALVFDPGVYNVSAPLLFNDKNQGLIRGNGAIVTASSAWTATTGAVLDMAGSTGCAVHDLIIGNEGGSPAAGIVIGRHSVGSSYIGGNLSFYNCRVQGAFSAASVYNSCGELMRYHSCVFDNTSARPAYYESPNDVYDLVDYSGVISSVEKSFYGCSLMAGASGTQTGTEIVRLEDNTGRVAFRDCYFSISGAWGDVVKLEDSATTAGYAGLLIDGCRVEHGAHSDTCLVRHNKPGMLRDLIIRYVDFTPAGADAMVHIDDGYITGSDITVLTTNECTAAYVLHVHDGPSSGSGLFWASKLFLPDKAGTICMDPGTEARNNTINVPALNQPFEGTGDWRGNLIISGSGVVAASDQFPPP